MADHVGVYAITGTLMASPATRRGIDVLTPSAIVTGEIGDSTYLSGTSIDQIPSQETLITSGTEVVNFNATYAGMETIESSSFGVVQIPTYLSKESRFNHRLYRHSASIEDLFGNYPDTAPSASYAVTPPYQLPYRAVIGSVVTVPHPGDLNPIDVTIDPSQVAAIMSASAANIIKMSMGDSTQHLVIQGVKSYSGGTISLNVVYADVPGLVTPVGTPVELYSWVPLFTPEQGVFMNSTYYAPAMVSVDVPEFGKIRDARAWVEFTHDHRLVGQSKNSSHNIGDWGLQSVQLALRSPNTNFASAHPLWNYQTALALPLRTDQELTGSGHKFGNFYYSIPELLKNSYLLWGGHRVDLGLADAMTTTDGKYHEFDYDIDMRTIFWDGSPTRNPRDLINLYTGSTEFSPGNPLPFSTYESDAGSKWYSSPTVGAFLAVQSNGWSFPGSFVNSINSTGTGSVTGADTPWFIDDSVDLGNIVPGSDLATVGAMTVPPAGWLTSQEAVMGAGVIWQSEGPPSGSTGNYHRNGRIVVRNPTNQVYAFGGDDVIASSAVSVYNFSIRTDLQQIYSGTPSILYNSTMPLARSRQGLAYYQSSVGEHVIAVGGAIAPGDMDGSTDVMIGTFNGLDINWVVVPPAQSIPRNIVDASVVVKDNDVFVLGGWSNGAVNTEVFQISLSVDSGMISGTWDSIGTFASTMFANAPGMFISSVSKYADDEDTYLIINMTNGSRTAISQYQAKFADATLQPENSAISTSSLTTLLPTGTNYFPPVYAGGHLIAVGQSPSPGTLAAELFFNTQTKVFTLNPWRVIGPNALGMNVPATSGTTAAENSIVFAGMGTPGILMSSNIIIQVTSSGEFPTMGLQLGPANIRPVYPLLDDVYAFKVQDDSDVIPGQYKVASNHGTIRGFRPGLRNTDTSGTWKVLFGMMPKDFNQDYGYLAQQTTGVWFRQARLEFITNIGGGVREFSPSRSRLWDRSSLVPGGDGYQTVGIVSGSAEWDVGLNYTQVFQTPDYGRSVGITSDASTVPDQFAVQTFITGALYDHLSASGIINADTPQPEWFLKGPEGTQWFGTPYIPDASMSLGITGSAEQIDASASAEIWKQTVGQTTLIPNANTMVDYLRRVNYSQTTMDRWSTTVASISGSSSL
jgi:hypothetical protein